MQSDHSFANLGAVVLCGGESRRMGTSKAWLPFGSERMLQRVVRLVGTVTRPIVVVAAPGQELPELAADIIVVRDPITGRGPLQGLATGLAALPDSVDLVYASATDVPFLEPRWILRLVELIGNHDLAIPYIGERYHPLAALYRRNTVLPVIEGLLSANRLKLSLINEAIRTVVVGETEMCAFDPTLGTLRNLNDLAAYEESLHQAGSRQD